MLVSFLQRVGDVNLTVDVSDAKRSESRHSKRGRWQTRIEEFAYINLHKVFVVRFHRAGTKIRHKKEIVTVGYTHRGTLVDRTHTCWYVSIIHCNDGVRGIKHRVPSRDGAIFRYENESAWQ